MIKSLTWAHITDHSSRYQRSSRCTENKRCCAYYRGDIVQQALGNPQLVGGHESRSREGDGWRNFDMITAENSRSHFLKSFSYQFWMSELWMVKSICAAAQIMLSLRGRLRQSRPRAVIQQKIGGRVHKKISIRHTVLVIPTWYGRELSMTLFDWFLS